MDPRQYLVIASELAACTPVEYRRSSINRAYYAAYGVAHQALESLGCRIPTRGIGHLVVREILQDSTDEGFQDAGHFLCQLYAWRHKADYRYENPLPEERRCANDCVRLAGYAINRVDEAMKDRVAARAAVDAALVARILNPLLALLGSGR